VHLLHLVQYYTTENQPGTVRHSQHAKYLVEHGHRVTVVSTFVTHTERIIKPEFEGKKIVIESQGNLTIYRTYSMPGYKRTLSSRLMNYLSFMFFSFIAALRVKDFNLVLASINPISVGLVGLIISRVRRVPFVLEVADLSADSAEALGVVRNRLFIQIVRWIETFLFRHSDQVIVMTKGIGDAIEKVGVSKERISFIPMGVDIDILGHPTDRTFRKSKNDFIAMYVGSYNSYACLETIFFAAELLKSDPDIRFVFIGGGDQRAHMEDLEKQLGLYQMEIHNPIPKLDVPGVLAQANVCILPYRDVDLFRGALPNKIFDYMGSGIPVIAGVREGEVTAILRESQAGICVAPEKPEELCDAIRWMHDHPNEARELGKNGRKYVLDHYDRRVIMKHYQELLESVISRKD
jgi:colanic acid biosynthesis glycosyl transferase WcaI